MATSETGSDETDHLSNLSDELLITILPLLPTHIAARTSLLSRRFCHLWEASPSLDLISQDLSQPKSKNFIAMADRALLRRNPSNPLLSLRLDLSYYNKSNVNVASAASSVSSLLYKALSLGLRRLTVVGFNNSRFARLVCVIFSISTLDFLSLCPLPHVPHVSSSELFNFPSGVTLTCLRSLSLTLYGTDPVKLSRLLSELYVLEDLRLYTNGMHEHNTVMHELNLFSKTIRTLDLTIGGWTSKFDTLGLFLPSLESLDLTILVNVNHINGEVPMLRKAVIALGELADVSAVAELLNCISHVEELRLCISESTDMECPIPILSELEKDILSFPNLKHLDMSACFHWHNFETAMMMLHHSPALVSLNLVHEVPFFRKKKKDWRSKLPRNADGNYRYARFRNLHLIENRKEFRKWISKKCASKRKTTRICVV